MERATPRHGVFKAQNIGFITDEAANPLQTAIGAAGLLRDEAPPSWSALSDLQQQKKKNISHTHTHTHTGPIVGVRTT